MKVIGITGGIGAGKTYILNYLKHEYGAKILIADEIGHRVMKKGTIGYQQILERFSCEVLDSDGEISKTEMAKMIFADEKKRWVLNQIIHPQVKAYIQEEIKKERIKKVTELIVIEAALLIEDHYETLCDEFWYIYTKEEIRRERLTLNRGYSKEKIDAIFASQATEETFREHCRIVIDNNRLPNEVYRQIDRIMKNREEL